MFRIRYSATDGGAYTTLTLSPGPSEVEYPEQRLMTVRPTQDGAHVVQRPMRDSRPRKWIWRGYTPSLTTYENQWTVLKTLEYRTRLEAALYPIVEIMEDVVDGPFAAWTKVKFLRVDRTPRKKGAIVYEDSTIEFVVVDDSFTSF